MPKKSEVEVVKCSMALPREVWKNAKIRAIEEDCDFQEIVAYALTEYLAKPARAKGARS